MLRTIDRVAPRPPAALSQLRGLLARYERRADILLGFLHLACVLICRNSLARPKR